LLETKKIRARCQQILIKRTISLEYKTSLSCHVDDLIRNAKARALRINYQIWAASATELKMQLYYASFSVDAKICAASLCDALNSEHTAIIFGVKPRESIDSNETLVANQGLRLNQ
jgi:hypothetical protein